MLVYTNKDGMEWGLCTLTSAGTYGGLSKQHVTERYALLMQRPHCPSLRMRTGCTALCAKQRVAVALHKRERMDRQTDRRMHTAPAHRLLYTDS